MIRLFDVNEIDGLLFENTEERSHLQMLMYLQSPSDLIDNVNAILKAIIVSDSVIPVTFNNAEYNTCYVCSIYTTFISYARTELKKINSPLFVRMLLYLINIEAVWFKAVSIDKVISINNFLLPTNLYPNNFSNVDEIPIYIEHLVKNYPDHAVIFRSLNEFTNKELIEKLKAFGFKLYPTRQVYIFDRSLNDYSKHRHCQIDLKLLQRNKQYIQVTNEHINKNDYSRIVELYNKIYLDKHSVYNPMFNEKYIEKSHQCGFINYFGLRNQNGVLDAIVGCYDRGGTTTFPILGYETDLPQNLGLYRMLMAYCIDRAYHKNITLNSSAGASQFKILRGGVPYIEYSALYEKHLPFFKRCAWLFLRSLLKYIGVPIMRKYKL